MSKVKLKYSLENKSDINVVTDEVIAIKQNNKITYNEKDVIVSIEFSNNTVMIMRRCEDYTIEINLVDKNTSSGIYYIKNIGTFDLSINTNILDFSNNKIYAEYELTVNEEVSKFIFSLEYEEML